MIFKEFHLKLEQKTSKSSILILFVLAHLVLLIMMLFTFPQINAKIGSPAFDLKTFGYSQKEAIMMIQNLDQSTVDFYIFPQLFLLDILYPILLALFLSTSIIRLSNLNKIRSDSVYSNLFLLPFIAMFMDYLENIMIFLMISNPIEKISIVIQFASIFTQAKGLITTLSWITILVLLGIMFKNNAKKSKTQSKLA